MIKAPRSPSQYCVAIYMYVIFHPARDRANTNIDANDTKRFQLVPRR